MKLFDVEVKKLQLSNESDVREINDKKEKQKVEKSRKKGDLIVESVPRSINLTEFQKVFSVEKRNTKVRKGRKHLSKKPKIETRHLINVTFQMEGTVDEKSIKEKNEIMFYCVAEY